MRDLQVAGDLGPRRPLDAMVRPEHLHAVGQLVVSKGCRAGWLEAKEAWPSGCQSCVSTTWRKALARRLIGAITASPSGTASAPPGRKSYWTSTTIRMSVSPGISFVRCVMPTLHPQCDNTVTSRNEKGSRLPGCPFAPIADPYFGSLSAMPFT